MQRKPTILFAGKRLAFVLWMLACFAGSLSAQVRLRVNVSPNPPVICRDELLEYSIILENSPVTPNFRLPSFSHFSVVGSPSRETGRFSVNGESVSYMAWTYTLQPRKTGRFRFAPVEALIAGKTYQSVPVEVEVKDCGSMGRASTAMTDPAAQAPGSYWQDQLIKPGEDAMAKAKKNLRLELEVDRRTCYVGEPVVATFQLFSRLPSESRMSKQPSFNGFSVIDLPGADPMRPEVRKMDGKSFNAYTLRKAQIYPLQPGDVEIEPAEVENDVSFIRSDYLETHNMGEWMDEFAMAMLPPEAMVRQTVPVRNEPILIQVKPLPEKDKPQGFTGAVGQFEVEASLERGRFPANESGVLSIRIRGKGNLQWLTAPEISWPEGVEGFEPEVQDETDKLTVPVSGSKLFRFPFSIGSPGKYILPSFEFSYFDPLAARYVRLQTPELPVQVDPAVAGVASPYAKTTKGFLNRMFYHRWWIIVLIAGLVLTGLLLWILADRRKQKRADAESKIDETAQVEDNDALPEPEQISVDPLQESRNCLQSGQPALFYSTVHREFRAYLGNALGTDPGSLQPSQVRAMMQDKKIPETVQVRVQQFMQDLQRILYSPFQQQSEPMSLLDEAGVLISEIEPYFRNR